MPFHLYREMNQRLILEAIDRFRISKRKRLFQYFHLYANGIRYTRYRVKRLQESIYLSATAAAAYKFFFMRASKKIFFRG